MIYYVDIDETICTQGHSDYRKAKPIQKAIDKINKLYDEDHTIIYWTARGTITKVSWREITEKQFRKWGVKYHRLEFGKPVYDVLICDKSKRIEEI